MTGGRFIRRNRVDEPIAAATAVGFGLLAALAGARPTGSAVVDVVLVAIAASAAVWASASAQWWAVAVACGIGAVMAFQPVVAAIGAIGFLGGLNVGTWRRDQSVMRGVIGGIAVNTLIRSELEGFFGLSAIIGITVASALFAVGFMRRPSRIRRVGWISFGVLGGVTVVGLLSVGVAAVGARPDLTTGARSARAAVSALNEGNYEMAAQLFDQASGQFGQAEGDLTGLAAAPGRLIPGVAQNLVAGGDLSMAAADATAEAASALRDVDPSALTVSRGVVDLAAIRSFEAPLERVKEALSDLRAVVDATDSPWLLPAVNEEVEELDEEFSRNEPRLQNAIDAVRLAPQMLGDDRARRYLLLFTTPAEARGLGGFVGSFATVEVDQGNISVTGRGRTQDLSTPTYQTDCSACPAELLDRYGRFGFTTGPGGTVGGVLWSNITMPAHFPYIAEAASLLYPQGFDQNIDGVVVLDPYVVGALMEYSGPVAVPELDVVVQPEEAAEFIIADQYIVAEDKGVRLEALDSLGTGAIAAILGGALPEPATIARDLGPLIAERRLLLWTEDLEEQNLLDRVGLLGSIPRLDRLDAGFSVSVSNASANKIDRFLDVSTDVVTENVDGARQLRATVTLRNDAPATGLPNVVIGNVIGLPDGWSRLFITFYGAPLLVSSQLDGVDYPVQPLPEAGWMAYSGFVDLSPGGERVFELVFDLLPKDPADGSEDTPTLWKQPLSTRD